MVKRYNSKQNNRRKNEQIRISPVVVIQDGENLGSMPTYKAIDLAKDIGLDLVEVSPNVRPPICKIMDYGKFKFEKNKKDKKNTAKSSVSKLKEIRLSPCIGDHDLETKVKSILKFLKGGHKVQLKLRFKRREIAFKQRGFDVIDNILNKLEDICKIHQNPTLNGRVIICVIESAK